MVPSRRRPSRSSAASKRSVARAGVGPRSGRPPGRPERERVATGEVAWLVRRWSVRTVSGRAGARPLRRGAWRARGGSSKRPTSRSAGARARGDRRGRVARATVVGSYRFRPSRSSAASQRSVERAGVGPRSGRPPGRPERERVATGEVAWLVRRWSVRTVSGRAGARPLRRGAWRARGWVLEAADLPVGRSASAWRPARSRGSCDGGRFVPFPAEQELGRFEEERGARGGGSSKRPTSRSAGARARGDRRGRVARATVVASYRSRPSRSSAASKRSVARPGRSSKRPTSGSADAVSPRFAGSAAITSARFGCASARVGAGSLGSSDHHGPASPRPRGGRRPSRRRRPRGRSRARSSCAPRRAPCRAG
jgi:hypothetical protein